MGEYDVMSLSQFTEWMAERGRVKVRAEWARRARRGDFGRKIGEAGWVVSFRDADRMLKVIPPDAEKT